MKADGVRAEGKRQKAEGIPLGEWVVPRVEKAMPAEHPNAAYIGLDDIEAHSTRLIGLKSASELKSSAKRFYAGDVLYSRLRPYLNKVWLANMSGLCSAEFIVLPPNQFIDAGFMKYRLNASDFVSFANSLNAGDRPRVDFDQISAFCLPPFSLAHQRHIVAKIEELFSELDAGVESLKTAKTQLAVYRQALLKKAFEGKLTENWRTKNADKIEPADQLLERIRKERENRYQQQLKEWQQASKAWEKNGKDGKKPTKPRKPKPVEPLSKCELAELPELPEGWVVLRYGDICSVVRNGLSAKPVGSEGYKISRISAVRSMEFDYSDYRYISLPLDEAREYTLRLGDLVFTRYNGSRRYVGVCAMFNGKHERLFPDKLIQTRPDLPSIEPSFLEKALNCGLSRAFLETRIRTTAGQSGVSGSDIKETAVPLCSLPEQQEIVRILEEQFSAIEQNEQEIDAALERSEALRQSILKKAFSGKLVPQDPEDEPADVLLKRIQDERQAAAVSKPKKKVARKRAVKSS